jgi:hypothetical protein
MLLTVVTEVVKHGGTLPQLALLDQKKKLLTKKTGVTIGILWFVVLTMFLTSFFAILQAPEQFVALLAITGVFGSIITIIGSLILLPSSKGQTAIPINIPQTPQMMQGSQQHNLPPQREAPIGGYAAPATGSWRDTKDLQPTSVTETTTRLLDEKDVPQ